MSGGVDSSVAAALFQSRGFDVNGVFMRLWQYDKKAEQKAKQVAKKIGIKLLVLDLRKEFKKIIVDYFLLEHKAGRTPNPCVLCNKEIKFRFLLKKMLELKADFVATGHYARLAPRSGARREVRILKAKDKTKDQSYFLWQLNQKELKKILLPIGDYTKSEVRAIAKKLGLPSAGSKESQEVCFIKTTTFDFLKKYLGISPGSIQCLDIGYLNIGELAKEVGKHKGLWFYTIGQRKGIGLSGGPYYVVEKDLKNNTLIVSKNKKDLKKKEFLIKNINWLSAGTAKAVESRGGRIKVQIRYNSPCVLAKITMFRGRISKHWRVVFDKAQTAITPGQSAVFYWRGQLLGGGIILE